MTTPADGERFLIAALDPMRRALHEDLGKAAEVAELHFAEFSMESKDYRSGRAHLARCHAWRLLSCRESFELGGWSLTPPKPNSALWLVRQALSLHLLRPLPGQEVPPPGGNSSRIAYYSNRHSTLYGPSGSDLIGLWHVDEAGDLSIRIVRPVGKWRYGANSKIDIDFPLLAPADSMESLEFRPMDSEPLFPFPWEDESGEEGVSGEPDR